MSNPDHENHQLPFVEFVDHAIDTDPDPPQAGEFALQDPAGMGFFGEPADAMLRARPSDALPKLSSETAWIPAKAKLMQRRE